MRNESAVPNLRRPLWEYDPVRYRFQTMNVRERVKYILSGELERDAGVRNMIDSTPLYVVEYYNFLSDETARREIENFALELIDNPKVPERAWGLDLCGNLRIFSAKEKLLRLLQEELQAPNSFWLGGVIGALDKLEAKEAIPQIHGQALRYFIDKENQGVSSTALLALAHLDIDALLELLRRVVLEDQKAKQGFFASRLIARMIQHHGTEVLERVVISLAPVRGQERLIQDELEVALKDDFDLGKHFDQAERKELVTQTWQKLLDLQKKQQRGEG